jgi:FG-GAP-like repeat/IPT/TIG domain/Secretion system C-terminal sorting domain
MSNSSTLLQAGLLSCKTFFFSCLFLSSFSVFGQTGGVVINYFSPQSGTTGTSVSIVGVNFTGAISVTFGATPAESFVVVDDTLVQAIVGSGHTGEVAVYTGSGYDSTGHFTFISTAPLPTISSFSPASAAQGGQVTIYGQHLSGATAVNFGGSGAASFSVVIQTDSVTHLPDTVIVGTVGTGATGAISVSTPGGTAMLAGFTYIPPPQPPLVLSFTPTSGPSGTIVTISGKYFSGTTSVTFGGLQVNYTILNDSNIRATVIAGNSGLIRVTNSIGYDSLGTYSFLTTGPPEISGFTPSSGTNGTVVNITGKNFEGADSLSFGGLQATSFTILSDTLITTIVGNGATGPVNITTAKGTGSLAGFNFTGPGISSVSPDSASLGDTVKIKGIHFTGTTAVSFGGTPATYFNTLSDSVILAVVGAGNTGAVAVTSAAGIGNLNGFVFLTPVPVINRFTPDTAITGQTIYIYGYYFTGATSVALGGISAASFSIVSDTMISVVVGPGTSGSVSVSTAYGNVSYAGFTYIGPPVLSSMTPAIAGFHDTVIVHGTYLSTADTVNIGGVPCASFVALNDTSLEVIVGTGLSGNLYVATRAGRDSLFNFTYSTVPVIAGFAPLSGPVGTSVTITGKNFSSVSANDIVYFGATRAQVTAASTTMISVKVPVGATYKPITVMVNTMTACSRLPFTVTFAASDTAFTPYAFAAPQNLATDPDLITVTLGDEDGDGKPDIVAGHNLGGGTAVSNFRNTGSPALISFAPAVKLNNDPAGAASNIAFSDLDGDGKPDLSIATGADIYSVSMFMNRSTPGTISLATNQFLGQPVLEGIRISPIDLDGDGRADLVVLGGGEPGSGNTLNIYRNLSSKGIVNFDNRIFYMTNTDPTNLVTADFDGDGKPDIAVVTPAEVQVFLNTSSLGNISFAAPLNLTIGGGSTYQFGIVAADLDGDGKIDLAATVPDRGVLSIFRNTSTPGLISFAARQDISGGEPENLAVTDLDGDGKPDLVASNQDQILIFKNTSTTGSISFKPGANYVGEADYIALGDVDGDGKPDLVIASSKLTAVSIYRNLLDTLPTPHIISFNPDSAAVGTTITIKGIHFTGVVAVSFGNVPASSFAVTNDSVIIAVVGTGLTGSVKVSSSAGSDSLSLFRFLEPPPIVSSFTPDSGNILSVVTISGKNFTGAVAVYFGAEPVGSFQVLNDSLISAVLGAGATGYVKVITPYGADSLSGFSFSKAPGIGSFSPQTVYRGEQDTIRGVNFTGATTVYLGPILAASYTVISDSVIIAVVGGNGAPSTSSGNVVVMTPEGVGFLGGLIYISPPVPPIIAQYTPTTAAAGTTVIITGLNLTGLTGVYFGGVPANSYSLVSNAQINAVVGPGASGYVKVTTTGGSDSLPGFIFIGASQPQPPIITSFTPDSAAEGSFVMISGKNFEGTSAISFGNIPANSFTIVNDTLITAVVGTGSSGYVSVITNIGSDSLGGFYFVPHSTQPDSAFHLIQFVGSLSGGIVQLAWETFNDASIANFVLERSADSTSGFEALREILSQKTNGAFDLYTTTDSFPGTPVIYYRLAITDTVGNLIYNNPIRVSLTVTQGIMVFPNPASGSVTLEYPPSINNAQISVVDMTGRVAKIIAVAPRSAQTVIDLQGLLPGVYRIVWDSGSAKKNGSLIVR